jgi:NTP pyrophosphatase (non-canonical NTP hydrolase)
MMTMSDTTLQDRVGMWGETTFPEATDQSIMAHMLDEYTELDDSLDGSPVTLAGDQQVIHTAVAVDKAKVAEEAADVYLLLLHLAHRHGFSLQDAAEGKFAIVQKRTYTTDSGRGYVRHDEVSA